VIPGRTDEHEILGDPPLAGELLDELGTELALDLKVLDVDLGVGLVEELEVFREPLRDIRLFFVDGDHPDAVGVFVTPHVEHRLVEAMLL
jgi:hypothetical protein